MSTKYKEILKGVIPAIIFMIVYKTISFSWAVIIGFSLGIVVYILQYFNNKKLTSFSYLGIFGLVVQSLISLLAENPNTYFIYPLISNSVYTIIFAGSLFLSKDAISFFAKDLCDTEEYYLKLKPVFRRLTIIWSLFFLIKTIVKFIGIINWSFEILYTISWILGTPATILLLWYSFEYPNRFSKNLKQSS